jgi:hypothetical protein
MWLQQCPEPGVVGRFGVEVTQRATEECRLPGSRGSLTRV